MAKMMVNRALIISVLVLLSMLFLVPMYVMVVTSLKTPYEISLAEYLSPPKFPYLSNYLKILDKMGEALIDTLRRLLPTLRPLRNSYGKESRLQLETL